MKIPKSECKQGYTNEELYNILGEDKYKAFLKQQRYERGVLCMGEECNEECHGIVSRHKVLKEFIDENS